MNTQKAFQSCGVAVSLGGGGGGSRVVFFKIPILFSFCSLVYADTAVKGPTNVHFDAFTGCKSIWKRHIYGAVVENLG